MSWPRCFFRLGLFALSLAFFAEGLGFGGTLLFICALFSGAPVKSEIVYLFDIEGEEPKP